MTQQKLQEVTWDRLDKRKFFVNGIFIFTGLTGCLFPLTVIKTRMMALDDVRHHKGFRGVYVTARDIVRADGYRGLYKGFGTVVGGLIPGRMMYLGILEASKKAVGSAMTSYDESLSEPFVASTSNFVAGALASLSGQLIAVPVDVVSQRQMIAKEYQAAGGATGATSQLLLPMAQRFLFRAPSRVRTTLETGPVLLLMQTLQ
jgi:solute carrier family 25 protein 44